MTCATGYLPRPSGSKRRPLPDWATYQPNSIWIYHSTHSRRLWDDSTDHRGPGVAQVDHPRPSPQRRTHLQVGLASWQALEAEDLLTSALERAEALQRRLVLDGDDDPVSVAAGRLGQRVADDRCQYPQVHGHGRHRPALRALSDPH